MRILKTIVLLLMAAGVASPAGPMTGDWTALIKVRDVELRLALHVTESPKGLEATFDSIDQKVLGMPVDKVEYKGGQLSFEITSIQAIYKGSLDKAGTKVTGVWSQLGMSLPLDFQKVTPKQRS
jgi:hypothetical protein